MSVETEIKVRIADLKGVRSRLLELGGMLHEPRHFEDNFVLDFRDGRLGSGHSLLRVRSTDRGDSVTFKGPPRPDSPFKQRQEIEFGVSRALESIQVFERLGLTVWFRYQKYREEFVLETPYGRVHVTLDETPIGLFAEIEGVEKGILKVAAELGFEQRQFLRDSYYSLYAEECRRRGKEPEHMVFAGQPSAPETPG